MPCTSSLTLLPPKHAAVDLGTTSSTPPSSTQDSFETSLDKARQKSQKRDCAEQAKKPAGKVAGAPGAKLSKAKSDQIDQATSNNDVPQSADAKNPQAGQQTTADDSTIQKSPKAPAKKAAVDAKAHPADRSPDIAVAAPNAPTAPVKSPESGKPVATDESANIKATVVAGTTTPQDKSAATDDPATDPQDPVQFDESGAGDVIKPLKGKPLGVSGADPFDAQAAEDPDADDGSDPANAPGSTATADATGVEPSSLDDILTLMDKAAVSEEAHVPSPHAAGAEPTALASSPFHQALKAAFADPAAKDAAPAATPQTQFVEDNHSKIITGVHGQLLPNGGSMQIRLDPPELGVLQVTVHMRDGIMTAAFETSNENATHLLSHSLSQLKTALESSGVSVEKLHVQQGSNQQPSKDSSEGDQQQPQQQQQARQEQQRRELMQRMWRKLAGAGDPLDMVA